MLKLVLVGNDQDRLGNLKKELEVLSSEIKELRISTCRPGYLATTIDSKTKALVFDTKTINRMVFPFIVQIRKLGYGGSIIVLGNPAADFSMAEFSQIKNVFQISKPYAVDNLTGMVRNCINIEKMRQRRDQRFDVREQATLEAYSSDFTAETVISNISRSGVRIEGNLNGLKNGDLLRLKINFDKINKERTMSARVVWMKKDGEQQEEAGLEFISQKAVYKYLLQYASA